MKKLIALSVLLCTLFSCSIESDPPPTLVPQGTWKLVRTHAQVPDSEATGTQMDFQETYQINADGTFVKTRVQEDTTTKAEGTYILEEEGYSLRGEAVILFIKMVYEERNSIIASCTSSQLEEDLYFTWNHRLVSTWEACDGLGLEYIKVKN